MMADAQVVVRVTNRRLVSLVISKQPDLSDSTTVGPVEADKYRFARFQLTDLEPNATYHYAFKIAGETKAFRGTFKTFPIPGTAESFTCAFASCARTGSTHNVFNVIKDISPDFFIHMGDFHYENIDQNDIDRFLKAYSAVFSSSSQSALYGSVPVVYVWDDHDYGPNNSDKDSPSKPAAQAAYRLCAPHYDLPDEEAIYQSFVYGRVRFIVTDLRSYRDAPSKTDDENKRMLGEEQESWFLDQLLKSEPVKVWVNTVPWVGGPAAGTDHWGNYATERKRLANFIKENDLSGRVFIISGDMHSLAIDDGTNSDYADGGGAPIPVFQAAPLDQSSASKGGPWAYGPFLGNGQFGVMTIEDEGDDITLTWSGRQEETELVSWQTVIST